MLTVGAMNSVKFRGIQNSERLEEKNSLNSRKAISNPGFAHKVPLATFHAYASNINFCGAPMKLKVLNKSESIEKLMDKYGSIISDNIQTKLLPRVGVKGQFLNWKGLLLKEQLSHVDDIYKNAAQLKKAGVTGKIGLIGIGGSAHPVENVCTLTGYDTKFETLMSVRPKDVQKFVKKLGNLDEAGIMVVSKSGTTTEPAVGFEETKKLFEQHFTKKFLKQAGITKRTKSTMSAEEFNKAVEAAKTKAKAEVAKRVIAITDSNPEKSALRKLATQEGYLTDKITDDVGGRYGAFDNHTLTMLAHNGMPKPKMIKMLKAAIEAQEDFFSTDMKKNLAAQKAAFIAHQQTNGRKEFFTYYYGDEFKGMPTWHNQLTSESIKSDLSPQDYIGTGVQHYRAEADCQKVPTNNRGFYNIVTLGGGGGAYKILTKNVLDYYPKLQNVMQTKMPAKVTPERAAWIIELDHATTLHTDELLRSLKGEKFPIEKPLPAVTQDSVEELKRNANKLRVK